MLELDDKNKIITKLSVIKDICSWLQTLRPSNTGGILGSVVSDLVAFYGDVFVWLTLPWITRIASTLFVQWDCIYKILSEIWKVYYYIILEIFVRFLSQTRTSSVTPVFNIWIRSACEMCRCCCLCLLSAIPVFRQITDEPHNMNVTEGDSVIVNCSAYAEPEAQVEWFENGEPLDRKSAHFKTGSHQSLFMACSYWASLCPHWNANFLEKLSSSTRMTHRH